MSTDDFDEQERWLIERIEDTQLAYKQAIQPYVDRLIQLRSWRLPNPVVMEANEFRLSLPKCSEKPLLNPAWDCTDCFPSEECPKDCVYRNAGEAAK